MGVLPPALQHEEEAIARYTPAQRRAPVFRMGYDPGVACRIGAATTLWLLGYPAQALVHIRHALTLAHELAHPYTLAIAWWWAALLAPFRRDVPAVYEQAEACIALTTAQGF